MKARSPRRRPQHPQRPTVVSTKRRRRPPQPTRWSVNNRPPGRSREPHKSPLPSRRDLYQMHQIWICTAPPLLSCHRRNQAAERSRRRRAPDRHARKRAGGEGPQIQSQRKSTPLKIGGQTSGVRRCKPGATTEKKPCRRHWPSTAAARRNQIPRYFSLFICIRR